ncbi:MAG: V-type ATP synthase subunit I [Eubacteriales bacterium]
MAIVPLKKVTLLALNREKDKILNALQGYGNLHISHIEEDEGLFTYDFGAENNNMEKLQSKLSDVQLTIKSLNSRVKRKGDFLAPKPELTLNEIDEIFKNSDDAEDTVKKFLENRNEAMDVRSELLRIESSISQVGSWKNLGIDVADIEDTSTCRIMVGTVPVLEFTEYSTTIDEIEFAEHEKIYTDRDSVYVLLMHHNNGNEEVAAANFKHSFSKYSFPFDEGTPEEYIKELKSKRKELEKQQSKLDDEEKLLADNLTALEKYHDALNVKIGLFEQVNKFGGTEYVFLLEGWIAAHEEKKFTEIIEETAKEGYEISFSDAEKDEEYPTLYENNAIVAPFEFVTNMFATSKTSSVDPNTSMAPFFALFFGMMLSDAGYGIILALSAAFVYFRTRSSDGKGNSLLALLAISGVSTIFWGFMFGGFMGFEIKPVLFNPIQEPILTLGLSLLLGIVQILYGMVLRAVMLIKQKRTMEAISQQFTWIALLVGIVILAFPQTYMFVGKTAPENIVALGKIGTYIALTGFAGILILGGYGQKGIKRITGGVGSLMDITGYLSDILSYARLFGLGLATGVIGMIVNQMAQMVAKGVFGWIAAIVIFVGVHLFNLAINSLGAYVHSTRLQYVEFFGKFFVDGGVPFKRFEPTTKYYNIRHNN